METDSRFNTQAIKLWKAKNVTQEKQLNECTD